MRAEDLIIGMLRLKEARETLKKVKK